MIRKIICASGNQGKLKELRAMLADCKTEVIAMSEAGITCEIPETGTTLEENAMEKASYVWEHLDAGLRQDALVMADDTGLYVDALDGRPGIYTARYAGENATDAQRVAKLLQELEGVEEDARSARFRCVIAYLLPDGTGGRVEGVMEGAIATEPRGSNGFGYDPVFYIPALGKTTAELTGEEKEAISHRGNAVRAFVAGFRELIE